MEIKDDVRVVLQTVDLPCVAWGWGHNQITFDNEVHLFKFVLAHIATKHPASALTCDWVATVNRATPHVANSIGINLCGEIQNAHREWCRVFVRI